MNYYIEISKKITKEKLINIFSKYGADPQTKLSYFAESLLEKDCKRILCFCNDSDIIIGALKNHDEFTYTWFFNNSIETKLIKYIIEQIKYNKDIS